MPAVSLRKRPASQTPDGILPTKRSRKDWVSHAELARLRKVADGQHESNIVHQDATYDVWAAPAPAPSTAVATAKETEAAAPDHEDNTNFIVPAVKAKPPKTMRRKPLSLAASGKVVPAVSKPAGSHSYNPLFEEYANRLQSESEKAVEAEKKRLAKIEADRLKDEAMARSAAEADAAEARAELSEWDEDSAWEGFETDADNDEEQQANAPRKQPKRKTTVQRNKYKHRKELEGQQKHDAAMKARDQQSQHIRQIAAQVAERDAQRAALAAMPSDSESEEDLGAGEVQLRKKRFGRTKLPEGDLELVLPDELRDSLRQLKPEGNLLKDRYRSMLVRGKLENRRRIPFKKKPNARFSEKWSYKDFRI